MTHSASGSWLPDEKRSNLEFFKKLHMLRDDLHVKERENMKSAIARIESKRYRRNKQSMEKEKKDKIRFERTMLSNRIPGGNNVAGIRRWKGGSLFDVKDTAYRPWEASQGIQKSGAPDHSRSQRSNQSRLHYTLATHSVTMKGGQLKPGTRTQKKSENRIPSLTDSTIAKIATNMNDNDRNGTYDFMRNPDHLPSIPSVGHRVSITHKNRLKTMTWESDLSEPSKTKRREVSAKANVLTSRPTHETKRTGKESLDKKKHEGLRFAVNLKDKDVFKYLNREVLPSTPSSVKQTATSAHQNIPLLSLSPDTTQSEDTRSCSPMSSGKLESAMRKLVTAHENFQNLKEELENIAHMNDQLESCTEFREISKEL